MQHISGSQQHNGQPTVILSQGVKGYGLGTTSAEGRNIAHNQLDMSEEELKTFRERFNLPLTDKTLVEFKFYKPDENSRGNAISAGNSVKN